MHQHDVLRMARQEDRHGVERFHARYCTTTLPVIFGWIEQK